MDDRYTYYIALFLFLLLLIILVLLPLAVLTWYVLDMVWTGEYFVTSEATVKKIAAALRANGHDRGTLYDLGSGRGDFLIRIMEECPELRGTGFDNSSIKIFLSRLRAFARGSKAIFKKQDFLSVDLAAADVVYTYIPRVMLPSLVQKIRNELKFNAIAITSREHFESWEPAETFLADPSVKGEEDVFIYRARA